MSSRIQNLLEQANSSEANDSSITFAKRVFLIETDAQNYFAKIRQNLFNLREWDKNSKASYGLYDENGSDCPDKIITVGKFICISVPGSGKDDWVKVIDIYDTENEFVITVQPSYNPTEKPVEKDVTSHFFNSAARNNFCLQRDDKEIVFYVIGLHEKTNTKETGSLIESVRNAATANMGYYLGVQKAMWKDFCANFLEINEKGKGKE
jgi:hypothetical protein